MNSSSLKMQRYFYKLNRFLLKKNYVKQLLVFFSAQYFLLIVCVPLLLLLIFLDINPSFRPEPHPHTSNEILYAIIGAPIIETFLNQWLTFKLFQAWPQHRRYYSVYIFISALIFGLMHYYSVAYMVVAFCIGLIFGYMMYFYRHNLTKAFWSIALVHALRNAIAVLFMLLV